MADDSPIRCFIALNFPPEVLAAAQELVRQLSCAKGRITWVKPEGVHLTFKFLGNIPASQLEEVKRKLSASAVGISPFTLQFTNLGVFPNQRQPRIIWWGTKCDSPGLAQLYQNIEKSLAQCGFPVETRTFSPHLTLGRIRELHQPKNLIELLSTISIPQLPPIPVRQVDLMQSTLGRDGAVYSRMAGVELAG
ncbi:MAG: RNA 2',3'-cyclic phosphodiesterase [Candidatus Schekmanbacteria bacterium]|nr:RNA 2',3'-cyclic phosphodiesterase [Candidatus Schekmanbacteria bacterium]